MRVLTAIALLIILSCTGQNSETLTQKEWPSGKLFIIGGGKRPPSMIKRLIKVAQLDSGGYGIILPMSSSEPDSAIYYAGKQFTEQGLTNIVGFNFNKGEAIDKTRTDSIENARLIYITGGDQNKFMDIAGGTAIQEAIEKCYLNGGVIAGTSAGAAVMSQKMITGNELKYPEYHSTFRNIETNNIELKQGLGFIKTAIIDQHFVKRSRHNRLISAVLENPDYKGVGIDESTAIVVVKGMATVIGESQVLVFHSPDGIKSNPNGKLSANQLIMSIFTSEQSFPIE